MKMLILFRTLFLTSMLALMVSRHPAQAQTLPSAYWVIETNVHEKPFTQIRMYTGTHELLYEERLEGKRLSARRKKDVRMLNTALTNVVRQTHMARLKMPRHNLVATLTSL